MNNPLVSILVPVYNVEAYLPQCLDSLLGQTYPHLQIVLIDDGSSDNSWTVMQQYAAQDNRIEIYHQENQGVATTRNHLLKKIKGDFVLFVDSDDWVELDMVEFLLSKALDNQADIVTCGNVINDGIPKALYKEEVWPQEKVIKEFLRHVNFNGSLWNKLIKANLLSGHRFDPRISYGEDALFTWHVIQEIKKIVVTDKHLYHYRMNESSLSHARWSPNKMGTGHIVWEQIEKDTKGKFPEFIDVASISFVISDMWQLYYAALSNYPVDEYIAMDQKHVKENLYLIRRADTITMNKKIFAEVISRNYKLGSLLAKLSR